MPLAPDNTRSLLRRRLTFAERRFSEAAGGNLCGCRHIAFRGEIAEKRANRRRAKKTSSTHSRGVVMDGF